jgi:calcium permeable stress-gated cation channel
MTTHLNSPSSLNPTATYPGISSPTAGSGRIDLAGNTVCLGHGLDASVDGLLVTVLLSGLTGLFLWVRCMLPLPCSWKRLTHVSYPLHLFDHIVVKYMDSESGLCKKGAYVLTRCVQFALILQRLRPTPLRTTLWAFFNPPVPMVPSLSNIPSDPADPAAADARRFPSDEELSQRTLWLCFLIASGLSIIGLVGALPLYTVSMPCLAKTAPTPRYMGGYSTLQDLSILRVLMLFDNRNVSTSSDTSVLEVVNGQDLKWRARLRVIIVTALLVVLGVIPALVKILREYSNLVTFRRKWTDVHLQGKEMGWISARDAPGFVGWGEKRIKDFILKTGLSSSLDFSAEPATNGTGRGGRSGRRGHGSPYMHEEDVGPEVDILSLFTIVYVSPPSDFHG